MQLESEGFRVIPGKYKCVCSFPIRAFKISSKSHKDTIHDGFCDGQVSIPPLHDYSILSQQSISHVQAKANKQCLESTVKIIVPVGASGN